MTRFEDGRRSSSPRRIPVTVSSLERTETSVVAVASRTTPAFSPRTPPWALAQPVCPVETRFRRAGRVVGVVARTPEADSPRRRFRLAVIATVDFQCAMTMGSSNESPGRKSIGDSSPPDANRVTATERRKTVVDPTMTPGRSARNPSRSMGSSKREVIRDEGSAEREKPARSASRPESLPLSL